jgi:hypothetical protein
MQTGSSEALRSARSADRDRWSAGGSMPALVVLAVG